MSTHPEGGWDNVGDFVSNSGLIVVQDEVAINNDCEDWWKGGESIEILGLSVFVLPTPRVLAMADLS